MAITTQSATLKLTYSFTSDPNPIIVSTSTSLRVIITNPTDDIIAVDYIEITIPVGEDTGAKLSTDSSLPEPSYVNHDTLSIDSVGSTVRIESALSGPLDIGTESISFNLPNINVNNVEGNVAISIYELLSSGQEFEDTTAYVLTKQESNFPVTNFYATPEILYQNGKTTTLFWDVSTTGKDCYYKLHAPTWANDTSYTWEDGQAGIASKALFDTTSFTLDILEKTEDGSTHLVDSLSVTVPVITPAFTEAYYQQDIGGIERLVRLHWLTENTDYCDIQVNNQTVVTHAPASTDVNGYDLFIGATELKPGSIGAKISLIAYSDVDENISVVEDLSTLILDNTLQHTLTYNTPPANTSGTNGIDNTYGIGISPDSQHALIMGMEVKASSNPEEVSRKHAYLNHVNLTDFSVTTISLSKDRDYLRISNAIATNETAYTIVNNWHGMEDGDSHLLIAVAQIHAITLSNNKVNSKDTPYGQMGVSFAADNSYLLSARSPYSDNSNYSLDEEAKNGAVSINIADIKNNQQVNINQGLPCASTVTPDGKHALISNRNANTVSLLDISQITAGTMTVAKNISVGGAPIASNITPDGKLALIVTSSANHVRVINMDTLTVEEQNIELSGAPSSIAILSNDYAFVTVKNKSVLQVIDIKNRRCITGTLTIGANPVAIAITPDKRALLAVQQNSKQLTWMSIS